MDDLIEQIQGLAAEYIPPSLLSNLLPYFPLYRRIYTYFRWAESIFMSTALPLVQRIQQNPDASSIALLMVILFVSFKILNMLRRAVVGWVIFSIKIALWSAIAWGALRLYTKGFNETAAEMGAYVIAAKDLWLKEYEKAKREGGRNR